tara:strand:- start:72 stop:530 length:459 start_codon:yes stop_codon:yes gene_type:complete
MGTRSLIRVIPRQEGVAYDKGHEMIKKSILNMYQQYDGSPRFVGVELAEFVNPIKIINGISGSIKVGEYANGPGCLAAQIVQEFKKDVGYTYLYATQGDIGDLGEEYIYTLYPKEGEPTYISIYDVYKEKCIFVGTPDKLIDKYKLKTVENG